MSLDGYSNPTFEHHTFSKILVSQILFFMVSFTDIRLTFLYEAGITSNLIPNFFSFEPWQVHHVLIIYHNLINFSH